jgi:hypothetical protein
MSDKAKIAIAVMGKALQEGGKVSCEYAARIAALAKVLRKSGRKYAFVVSLGGKPKRGQKVSEARAAKITFKKRYPGLYKRLTESRIKLEQTSTNSIENMRHLAQILRERDFDRVDLVSTQYHLERLETVDRFMKNQSLLQCVGSLRGDLIGATYYFADHKDAVVATKADVYQLADQLNVPRVNVEGILEAKEQRTYPGVTDCFAKAVLALYQRTTHSEKRLDALGPLRTLMFSSLPVLSGCLSFLLSFQTRGLSGTSDAIRALRTVKGLLDRVIDDLRKMTDQDRPVTPSDWVRIEL